MLYYEQQITSNISLTKFTKTFLNVILCYSFPLPIVSLLSFYFMAGFPIETFFEGKKVKFKLKYL